MHKFDRGIIKWLPFDALTGFKEAILKLKETKNKKDKPKLSIDQLEFLDENLKNAHLNNSFATIYYYEKGFIYYIVGQINKVDFIYKRIRVANKWLEANSILKIEVKD